MTHATERFRRQHAELVELAGALSAILRNDWGALRADEAQMVLSRIAGKLRIHSAMENDALYPRLLRHDDAEVRHVARRFVGEFSSAYRAFLELRSRWVTADTIAERPDVFRAEAESAITVLSERIAHENAELYPMVDALYPE